MKLKDLTENKYTTEDIFTNNYHIWFTFPIIFFIASLILHLILFSFGTKEEMDMQEFMNLMLIMQYPGDNLYAIVRGCMIFGLISEVVAIISKRILTKRNLKYKEKRFDISLLFFTAFVVCVVISLIVNKVSKSLVLGYTPRGQGAIYIILYSLLFYYCGTQVKKEKYKENIIKLFFGIDLCLGILTIIDELWFKVTIFYFYGVNAIFYNQNFYGYYLTIATMLSLAIFVLSKQKKRKIAGLIIFIMNSFLINMVDTFGCFLACIGGMVFLLIAIAVRDKKLSVYTLVGLVLFLAINIVAGFKFTNYFGTLFTTAGEVSNIATGSSDAVYAGNNRWDLWKLTVKYIKERPLFGWGTEGICERLGSEALNGASLPHNEYLEYTAYYGIPAGLLYIAAVASVFINGAIKHKYLDNVTLCCMAGAFGYACSACFGNTMYFIAPYFFIFLGLSTVHKDKEYLYSKICKAKNAEDNSELARAILSDARNIQENEVSSDGNEMEA